MHRHAQWIVATISTICLILTVAVYLYVKMLRNTLGKCIVSCLFSMVMVQVIFIQNSLNFLFHLFPTYCIIYGKVFLFSIVFEWARNFFQFAYFIWLSVISYHLWQVFKSPKCDANSKSFLAYSAFVWITAAIMTVVFFFMNTLDDESLIVLCMLLGSLIFNIFNLIMFMLTTINICKVKGEMKRFTRRKDKTTTCFNFDTQTTLKLIMESIRERQIKRRVRAQMERDLP
ncbi:probable G-protein coupled receptor Mth-like 7 [Drosophila subpulchrella]|uniref:probable G-protein coupled receptor Mth-like 7 n=1 Tax=Drosophila subpulchrella TaxID=1486046 RepID=UPI0018A1A29A|nr:probable G-protein coupled receptor Mth-like 7 [Drosophila subpulchrella]